jgi:hypothetical protein
MCITNRVAQHQLDPSTPQVVHTLPEFLTGRTPTPAPPPIAWFKQLLQTFHEPASKRDSISTTHCTGVPRKLPKRPVQGHKCSCKCAHLSVPERSHVVTCHHVVALALLSSACCGLVQAYWTWQQIAAAAPASHTHTPATLLARLKCKPTWECELSI